jgi:hypothetical protein
MPWAHDEVAPTQIGDASVGYSVRTAHHSNDASMCDTQHFASCKLFRKVE